MFELIRSNQLNIMLLLCGACAITTFQLIATRFLSKSRKRVLIMMEITAFFLLWFDRLAYIYAGAAGRMGYIMVRVSNFAVFFLTSWIILSFNIYLTDLIMHEGGMKSPPRRLRAAQLMAILGLIMAVVSAFTDFYYYIDETNTYHRGDAFLAAYIVPVICPLIQYTVIRQHKKLFSKLIYVSLVLYIFVPLSCGILQIFTYGISIVNMAMVLVSISLYFFNYLDINSTVEKAYEIQINDMKGEQVRMRRLFSQTAKAFVSAVEKKDEYLKGNSEKVAEYAKRVAERYGKSEDECREVYYAALLHDVGLIGIPDEVIKKDAAPGEDGYEAMKQIPVIGNEILSSIEEYPYLGVGAHYSHERYDGKGYPGGLKGDEIPEIARIIAVADAYVNMTTKKRRHEAKPEFVAREALVRGGGEEFDPVFSELMIKVMDEDINKGAHENDYELETELVCGEYRDSVSCGIPVENEISKIAFTCAPVRPEDGREDYFSAPSIIIFDSFDHRAHDNERSIDEYQYLEYGEFWFDKHSISTAARRIREDITEIKGGSGVGYGGQRFEIIACRYDDHLRVRMTGPKYDKKLIIALPSGSKAAYIGITGEHCRISELSVEKTGNRVGPNDIPRIAEAISYIDRMESDIKNIQIDTTRSASTPGIEIGDRLTIDFHTMSLPGAGLVWHCPYFIIFHSSDGKVGGPSYREYAVVKLYGENDGSSDLADNSITIKKTDEFPGWNAWKELNKEGIECEVSFKRKEDRIIMTTKNLGIEIDNTTTIKDGHGKDKIYAAITGDQVALTDIRVRNR